MYIESTDKSAAKKVDSLYRPRQIYSPESILHIFMSTIRTLNIAVTSWLVLLLCIKKLLITPKEECNIYSAFKQKCGPSPE